MDKLRKLRQEKNISQVRLSIELGVSQETISAYEWGKALPTAENLIKLAKFLNTSTDYLLDLTDIKLPVSKISTDKLSEEEFKILSLYRNLSARKKDKFNGYLDSLID